MYNVNLLSTRSTSLCHKKSYSNAHDRIANSAANHDSFRQKLTRALSRGSHATTKNIPIVSRPTKFPIWAIAVGVAPTWTLANLLTSRLS